MLIYVAIHVVVSIMFRTVRLHLVDGLFSCFLQSCNSNSFFFNCCICYLLFFFSLHLLPQLTFCIQQSIQQSNNVEINYCEKSFCKVKLPLKIFFRHACSPELDWRTLGGTRLEESCLRINRRKCSNFLPKLMQTCLFRNTLALFVVVMAISLLSSWTQSWIITNFSCQRCLKGNKLFLKNKQNHKF